MEKILNDYLEAIEKHLKPMSVSERVDFVQEIKSEMIELQNEGFTPQEIIRRLGNPKELARSYLGETISQTRGFSLKKLSAVIAFYSLSGMIGITVLPVTSIVGITFLACSILVPLSGIVKLGAHLVGIEMEWIRMGTPTYQVSPEMFLPLSIVLGLIFFIIGWLLWKLTLSIINSFIVGKRKLNEVA